MLHAESPGWTDLDQPGEIKITLRMDPQATLDLEKLAKAGSVKTDMKKVTIHRIIFRNAGTIVATEAGYRLEGLPVRVDLRIPEKIRAELKEGRVKATVTGTPVQKSVPDPDDPEKVRRHLEVTVTKVTFKPGAPAFDLSALVGSWSHHRERSSGGIELWVRGGNLPPSRFRGKMIFKANGKWKDLQSGTDDGHYFADGTWRADGEILHVRYTTTHNAKPPIEARFEVVSLKGDELRLKRQK